MEPVGVLFGILEALAIVTPSSSGCKCISVTKAVVISLLYLGSKTNSADADIHPV